MRQLHGVPLPPGLGSRRLVLDYSMSGLPAPDAGGASVELQVAVAALARELNWTAVAAHFRLNWKTVGAVTSALGGRLEGRCLRMADYVRGPEITRGGDRRRRMLMLASSMKRLPVSTAFC